jgi:hypothetical protein
MSIYKKLFEAKKEIGKISKDSTNPFYKSKYFDINSLLEHVEPILQKHGLLLLQPIEDNIVYSKIIDIDDLKTGVLSGLALTNQTDPQKRGSEITYYRRYTLQSLLGLQAEDDDANATVNKQKDGIYPSVEDTRPWLDEKGFTYLLEKGSDEEIQTAFKTRRMKKDYRTQLENK